MDKSQALDALLEQPFWIQTLKTESVYQRMEDDTSGFINVCIGKDGDSWITVMNEIDPKQSSFSFRFRTPLIGGGESPRVRNALLILAEAIRRDNAEHPQNRS